MNRRRRNTLSVVVSVAAVALGTFFFAASAQAAAPHFTITSNAAPTNFSSSVPGSNFYAVTVVNDGNAPTDGSPITITDDLPAHVTFSFYASNRRRVSAIDDFINKFPCAPGPPVTCVAPATIYPGEQLVAQIVVDADAGAPATVTNHVSVSGGGAPPRGTATRASPPAPPSRPRSATIPPPSGSRASPPRSPTAPPPPRPRPAPTPTASTSVSRPTPLPRVRALRGPPATPGTSSPTFPPESSPTRPPPRSSAPRPSSRAAT